MDQRLSLVTLAVKDLAAARTFYEELGWQAGFANEDVAFYQLNGIVLSLWRRASMAQELSCHEHELGPGGIMLAYNVPSAPEVDAVLSEAGSAGASVRAPLRKEWGGYSGSFADPDGHRWEVAWNPAWPIAADGAVQAFPPRAGAAR